MKKLGKFNISLHIEKKTTQELKATIEKIKKFEKEVDVQTNINLYLFQKVLKK